MEKRTIASISVTCGILWIFIFQYALITFTDLRQSLITAFHGAYAAVGPGIFAGTILVLSGVIFGAFIFQLLAKRFEVVFAAAVGLLYLFSLWYVLFDRTPGTRGINLDITQFGAQFASTPLDMMWNIAIFLPLGMVLQALIKSMWKTAIGAAVLALIVEGAQYIFSVGIFDILDIVLNVGGIMLGALIISSAMLDGWHFGMDRHFLTLTK
ncbi:VanZ family protein [Pseudoscardovia suis]|uniref:VanZ-like protein n=1 Tax=Pseudoscardovia suis TaxID=987063 RepID=A0A261EX12_9BIFI|nr:VanZ family protein [Pseudoscardovia suis]OZG51385.1 VanZ-like protein [Pseudoscardovia suis]PJJ68732.1 VanZ like protein [Pseudoscardovia suis]